MDDKDIKFIQQSPSYVALIVDGAMDAGAWSCGMVAGLIHDIPTVKALIYRMLTEAESIISRRLAGMPAS